MSAICLRLAAGRDENGVMPYSIMKVLKLRLVNSKVPVKVGLGGRQQSLTRGSPLVMEAPFIVEA